MKTLENILQEFFNCKRPFLKNPYYDKEDKTVVTMTNRGCEAYSSLIELLYDVGDLTGQNVEKIVTKLDEISSEL